MDNRDLLVVAVTVLVFAAVALATDPLAGLGVAAAVAFFLVASIRYRDSRW